MSSLTDGGECTESVVKDLNVPEVLNKDIVFNGKHITYEDTLVVKTEQKSVEHENMVDENKTSDNSDLVEDEETAKIFSETQEALDNLAYLTSSISSPSFSSARLSTSASYGKVNSNISPGDVFADMDGKGHQNFIDKENDEIAVSQNGNCMNGNLSHNEIADILLDEKTPVSCAIKNQLDTERTLLESGQQDKTIVNGLTNVNSSMLTPSQQADNNSAVTLQDLKNDGNLNSVSNTAANIQMPVEESIDEENKTIVDKKEQEAGLFSKLMPIEDEECKGVGLLDTVEMASQEQGTSIESIDQSDPKLFADLPNNSSDSSKKPVVLQQEVAVNAPSKPTDEKVSVEPAIASPPAKKKKVPTATLR